MTCRSVDWCHEGGGEWNSDGFIKLRGRRGAFLSRASLEPLDLWAPQVWTILRVKTYSETIIWRQNCLKNLFSKPYRYLKRLHKIQSSIILIGSLLGGMQWRASWKSDPCIHLATTIIHNCLSSSNWTQCDLVTRLNTRTREPGDRVWCDI